jgi:hypothetical protein
VAADRTPSSSSDDEPRLSWRDRELLAALRRVANSRAQVQSLEAAVERQREVEPPQPADAARAQELHDELAKLRAKGSSRFGGGAARDRIPDVELQLRLVLERLGYQSYAAFEAGGRRPAPDPDHVDPALVDFAHRELEAAERAYEQVISMPDDDDDAAIDLTKGDPQP